MKNWPFFAGHSRRGSHILRLHSGIYKKSTILRALEKQKETRWRIFKKQKYYFVEMPAENINEYMNFLNYLVYLERSS